jgi:hypothetical protein
MFIKDLIYIYNAQELLLTASRLVFALYALIFIMELIVVLLLFGKKKKKLNIRDFNPLF